MSEQAIETENEIITETEIDNVADGEETIIEAAAEVEEEVEIIVEGEDKPASKSRAINGIQKRINKLNGKIDVANTQADEANQRADALEQENKLLRLSSEKPVTRPDEDDFETTAEYHAALDGYDGERITKAAQEQVAKLVQQNQTQTTQVNQNVKLEEDITAHYARADTLKMSNYEELEDKAIEALGNDLSKVIMANTEKSHLIMAHLGANPGKAAELVELVKVNPVKALVKAVEIGNSLSVKTKSQNAPDPETTVDAGIAAGHEDFGPKGATYEQELSWLIHLKATLRERQQ